MLDKSIANPTAEWIAEQEFELNQLVDQFAQLMKAKLLEKAIEGRTGWNLVEKREELWNAMLAHGAAIKYAAGQEVDVANFAMFLLYQRIRIEGAIHNQGGNS